MLASLIILITTTLVIDGLQMVRWDAWTNSYFDIKNQFIQIALSLGITWGCYAVLSIGLGWAFGVSALVVLWFGLVTIRAYFLFQIHEMELETARIRSIELGE